MKTLKILASIAVALIALTSFAMSASAQGPIIPAVAPVTTPLDAATTKALTDALNDEYHAHAFYAAVIAKFGQVAPFTNILRSEQTHIDAIKNLMVRYGVTVPADSYTGTIQAPATLREALQAAVDAEIANVAMYDRFTGIAQSDITSVFQQLRDVSQTRHLPAFQNALNGNTTGLGGGFGGNFGSGFQTSRGRWGR